MREWIEKGWVATEVSMVVDLEDIDTAIARMDPSYRTFGTGSGKVTTSDEGDRSSPHRGKIVVRVRQESTE